MLNLTQKETMLLNDQKSHEEACIQKYTKYANEAQDPQLKQMFTQHANQERQHLNTINQILSGQVPSTNSGGSQGGQSAQNNSQNQGMMLGNSAGNYSQKDAELCQDLLMTEKYVSSTYNTTIFECMDTNVRKALNHIQKEEQQHGEDIFNYMYQKGIYKPQ